MLSLKPFSPINHQVFLEGDIFVDQKKWQISFNFNDLAGEVVIPPPHKGQRRDGLWKQTCFEAFLGVPSKTTYYEFNFSPSGDWNIYKFEDYRSPQPPKESHDFIFDQMEWKNNQINVFLTNHSSVSEFEVSLNAVIELKNGERLYFATSHGPDKPDFHLRQNFIFKRGLK